MNNLCDECKAKNTCSQAVLNDPYMRVTDCPYLIDEVRLLKMALEAGIIEEMKPIEGFYDSGEKKNEI